MESGVAPLGVITVPWMKFDQTFHLFFSRLMASWKIDSLASSKVFLEKCAIRSATCDSLSDTPTTSIQPSCQIFWHMMAQATLLAKNARWTCMGKLSSVPFFVVSMHMIHRRLPKIELLTHFVVRLENSLNSMPPSMVTSPSLLNKCLTKSLAS
jgi:hypothetical protein